MPYANNKGADQPAHLHSLISTFIVRCLDSMICILALSKVSRFYLFSVAEQAGLNLTWLKIPEDTFLRDMAQMMSKNMSFWFHPTSLFFQKERLASYISRKLNKF